jgi:hypothetical protein
MLIAVVWLVAGYWPVGFLLVGGAEDGIGPDWVWLGLIFSYYVIAPTIMLYTAFRLVRPIR